MSSLLTIPEHVRTSPAGVAGVVLHARPQETAKDGAETLPGSSIEFAVKIFRSSQLNDAEHEAKMLRCGEGSRHIVTLHEVVYTLDWVCLVLEFCPNGSLHDRL